MRIFVAGTGFSGARVAKKLVEHGHEVVGLNRQGCLEDSAGMHMVAGDVLQPDSLVALKDLPPFDAMISALSASGFRDPELYRSLYVHGPENLSKALCWKNEKRLWLLGSTGVYGEESGEWVDEDTPAKPLHRGGRVQLEAEHHLRSVFDQFSVIRLSGLYGPDRTRLIRQALRMRPYFKADIWSNQIHVDDVAGILTFLVDRETMPEVLLASDDLPVQRKEIFDWIRSEKNCADGLLDEDHPAAGRNRGNKRVRNTRLRELGYKLIHPDYRSGLKQYLDSIP